MILEQNNAFVFKIDDVPDEVHLEHARYMKSLIDLKYHEAQVKLEGEILSAVSKVGITVDKERLLQAVTDARAFYCEGFEDGKRDAQKWIPVTEQLPEKDKYVWCHSNKYGSYMFVGYRGYISGDWMEGGSLHIGDVTHWMPLPEPPKEVEG